MACNLTSTCGTPGNQTVDELDQWTQYSTWGYNPDDFELCPTNKAVGTLQINEGSGFVTMSASTKIKIVSGSNPQTVTGQVNSCNAGTTPRATWTLGANTGSGGSAWPCRVQWSWNKGATIAYYNFTITVNTAAVDVTITPAALSLALSIPAVAHVVSKLVEALPITASIISPSTLIILKRKKIFNRHQQEKSFTKKGILLMALLMLWAGCATPDVRLLDENTTRITPECPCYEGAKIGKSIPSGWDVYENCECIDGVVQP